jgi:anoctamin-10/anoctamin-7
MSSSLEDYAEVAIGFGYTALFVSALPMAAALAFVSNAVEIKADGWKLLTLHQRPFPKGCEDIGSWYAPVPHLCLTLGLPRYAARALC